MLHFHDRTQEQKDKRRFERVRKAEKTYARKLRGIAKQVGELADAFNPSDPSQVSELVRVLRFYAEAITPWARATASAMLADVLRRDENAWVTLGASMERNLREEVLGAPLGDILRQYLNTQVHLITSLPLVAAERAHEIAQRAVYSSGARAAELAKEIAETGEVTKSRANLIARTEVARASSALVMVRAQHIGSTHYIWKTSGDSDVRPIHKKLNGQVFRWDDPPITGEKGERSLPGGIYNCRCFPDPILPEKYQ